MGAQKCMLGIVDSDTSAAMVALQYCLGMMRANRMEQHGGVGVSGSGSSAGDASVGAGGIVVWGTSGVVVGVFVGGMLARVCCMCRCGAVREICGAIGFVEVGWSCGEGDGNRGVSPFEVGQGSESSSYGPAMGVPLFVSVCRASMMARKRCWHLCCGSWSIPRRSSQMTWWRCWCGVSVGRQQCCGYNL